MHGELSLTRYETLRPVLQLMIRSRATVKLVHLVTAGCHGDRTFLSQDANTALVTKALEPIWTAKPETASRVRGRLSRCSIGQKRADIATARTPRAGAGI